MRLPRSALLLLAGLAACALNDFYFNAETYLRDHRITHWDVVIVPGYPFDGVAWNKLMEARVRWAAFLYHQGIADHLLFSGSAVYTPWVEARVMKLYAEQLGVPPDRILTEEVSMHSVENLYYGYVMARKAGFDEIAVATDVVQYRMLLTINNNTFGLPVGWETVENPLLDDVSPLSVTIDPSSAFVPTFRSIEERRTDDERALGNRGGYIVYDPAYLPKYKVKYPSPSLQAILAATPEKRLDP